MHIRKLIHYSAMAFGTSALVVLTAFSTDSFARSSKASTFITSTYATPQIVIPAAPVKITAAISAEEIAGLKFMREEEKLAHDVYTALSYWPRNVFKQIAVSETTHTEVILGLLNKYGVADPAAGKAPGVFEDHELQDLYDTLVAMGKPTLIDALKVGALIEETDIHDIEVRKAVTKQADILRVYDNLLSGSCNHLRAFNSQLKKEGISYVPKVITQSEWDAVVNSTSDKCGK